MVCANTACVSSGRLISLLPSCSTLRKGLQPNSSCSSPRQTQVLHFSRSSSLRGLSSHCLNSHGENRKTSVVMFELRKDRLSTRSMSTPAHIHFSELLIMLCQFLPVDLWKSRSELEAPSVVHAALVAKCLDERFSHVSVRKTQIVVQQHVCHQ